MNPIIFYLLGGGFLMYGLLRKNQDPIIEGFKNNISFKSDDIIIRSLSSQSLELDVKVRVKNDNIIGGEIKQMIGFVSLNGIEIGRFSIDQPTNLPPKEETLFEFDVFVDITDRGPPAVIRNTFRNGFFSGELIISGAVDTTYGSFSFQNKVKIL